MKLQHVLSTFGLLAVMITSSMAHAEIFRNSYISFELPANWSCRSEGTEWVCFSKINKKAKEAIIILTAKEAGPADSFNFYETYLKQERTVPNAKGQPMKSKVLHVKKVGLAKHTWVDGMHLSSEIEDFYTRYLATVKQGLAIIVSFSAHKAYYTKYSSDFLRAIKSLKVVANRNLLAAPNAGQKGPTTNPFGGPTNLGGNLNLDDPPKVSKSKNDLMGKVIGGILLLLIGAYFIFKKRKK